MEELNRLYGIYKKKYQEKEYREKKKYGALYKYIGAYESSGEEDPKTEQEMDSSNYSMPMTLEKDYSDTIYLTRIKQRVNDADTFFPKLDYSKEWEVKDVKSCSEGYGKDYDICLIAKKS